MSIHLYRLLDALGKLPLEFRDQSNQNAEVANLLPIVSDFLADNFQLEEFLDKYERTIAALSPEGRRVFLMIIGTLVHGGLIPLLTQADKFNPKKFAEKTIFGTLPQVADALGKLVPPSLISGDPDRAEEFCRKVVRALDLSIDGETAEDSKARLFQLDSVELDKVQKEVEAKIQKALEEARAREAASKPQGE